MKRLAAAFEKQNPDIRVTVQDTSGYDHLNTAIQDGYGMPDVVQLEYYALPQYAVSEQLLDITDRVKQAATFYTPGSWASVQLGGRVYGMPMDSGPMVWFYNEDVFRQAGVDARKIRTWEDYRHAARKLKDIGVYIAADAGDASFYAAMIWLSGGKPFRTSHDGKTVTVNLLNDAGTQEFTKFWQSMIDEGLIDTRSATWSHSWKRALNTGKVASVFSGAWMTSLLLANVSGTAGLWRVSQVPTKDGSHGNAHMGGSALAILQLSRKPEAAMRFVQYVCHTQEGISQRVAGGAFPADVVTLRNRQFLDKTTVRDARGIDIAYFGGQCFNRVFAHAAEQVRAGYQYLPFEVFAHADFRSTVAQAYRWSSQARSRLEIQELINAGVKRADGSDFTLPQDPGVRISLRDGLELWQEDLKEYGYNQGFVIQ